MSYKLAGMLALALGMGCAKPPAPAIPEATIADLAAWVPEEMEFLVVASSLEALKTSLEQVKGHASAKQFREFLEDVEEEMKEATGLDLFALSTWQEMGLKTQAPLMLSSNFNKDGPLFVLPVADQARFFEAVEKHLASQGRWQAQPDMPQALRAWEVGWGNFILMAPKAGQVLILLGEDLELLKKRTQLPQQKSWARHKDMLLKIDSRLPANRTLSAWVRFGEARVKEVEWLGLAVATQPRIKVVADMTWRPGQKPFLPKMQTVPLGPQPYAQGLGGAAGGLWSAVTWDWYVQLFKHPLLSRGTEPGAMEMLFDVCKQNLKPSLLARGWMPTPADEGDFRWSVDVLLNEESSAEKVFNILAAVLSRSAWASKEKATATQPNPAVPVWEVQAGEQTLWAQVFEKNRVRIANRLTSDVPPDALQKEAMKEMTHYPVGALFHLNALLTNPMLRLAFQGNSLEKAEYILLGLRAEEAHAQLTGEHFVEAR